VISWLLTGVVVFLVVPFFPSIHAQESFIVITSEVSLVVQKTDIYFYSQLEISIAWSFSGFTCLFDFIYLVYIW